MATLYTVRMKRKILHITSAGEELRLVDEVYHDLPLITAQRYREKFPDAGVVIEPTQSHFKQARPAGALAGRDEPAPPKRRFEHRRKPKADRVVEAARAGDMGAAVTAARKGLAR